ncbi:hypothetical protein GCM10020331_078760 [Ectobacillus funiculus]
MNIIIYAGWLPSKEEDYTLLDTMILEGLAEAAVAERYSKAYHAPWTRYYTKQEAVQFWHRYVNDKNNCLSRNGRA